MLKNISYVLVLAAFIAAPLYGQESETLLFQYHAHYFTDKQGVTTELIDAFIGDLNQKLSEQFEKAKGETSGKVILYSNPHLSVNDPKEIKSYLTTNYPGVVIAEGKSGYLALRLLRDLGLVPLVVIMHDVPDVKSLEFDYRIQRVISVFGEDSDLNSELVITNKEKQFNIAVKGFKDVDVLSNTKLRKFLVDLEYRAILEAILWGNNQYT